MRKFIKKIAILLAMILVFSCVTVDGNVALAKTKKTTQVQKAKKAYADRLAKAAKGYDIFDFVGTVNNLEFAIIDLNKDSIPELIISADEWYHSYVYTYVNGKLRRIVTGYAGCLEFYPSKGLIYSRTIHMGAFDSAYYKFDGKKVKVVATVEGHDTYNVITGKVKTGNALESYAPYLYKVNNKRVSSKKYNSYVKQLKGKAKMVKQSNIKLVRNTASNRLKKLGYKK